MTAYKPVSLAVTERPKAGRERREAYWKRLIELLEKRQSPWLPLQPVTGSLLEIPLPAYDVSLFVQLVPNKTQLIIRLRFERSRGKQIFAALLADLKLLDAGFKTPPTWTEGKEPEIALVLPQTQIRDPLDWLEQHEWVAARLAEFHRTFYQRLSRLDSAVKEANPKKQVLFEYWTAFDRFKRERQSKINGVKPLPQHWNTFIIGRSHFWMDAFFNRTEKRVGINLIMGGPHAKDYFDQLLTQKEVIEKEIGAPLDWRPGEKRCRIFVHFRDTDPSDPPQWPVQHSWLLTQLERFHQVFQPRIKALSTAAKTPD